MASGKLTSIVFRFIFFTMGIINYFVYVPIIWLPIAFSKFRFFLLLLIFHFFFGMSVWATTITIRSDPGQVPLYWGFYIGDPDSKRSRYCLMCNVFKPVRCHHCSVCNRCVLNMDHHCPWINNCIGFYNRKYFIQMVMYLNFTLITILLSNGFIAYDYINILIEWSKISCYDLIGKVCFLILYLLDCAMEVILIQFFKFHIKLVIENKTTIEILDHKGAEFHSKFDRGKWDNFYEVMGMSKVLWFFPIKLYYGKPKGNGIDWGEGVEEAQNFPMVAQENNEENKKDEEENNYNGSKNNENEVNSGTIANRVNSKDNSQISMLNRNHPGHSSMSSLY